MGLVVILYCLSAMSVVPEDIHSIETAIHESFLHTLNHCSKVDESLDSPNFTQCIKAAGVNFGYSYQAFLQYRFNTQIMSSKGLLE